MNEDWDDMAMAEPLAGEELERMLARYSRVRLDPSHAQAKRARTVVMEAAWRRRIDANRALPLRPARGVPFSGWGVRRFGASLTAAVFAGLMIGTSVFAASRAGGPLYETRIAIEELGYPSEPGARADAQVEAADNRLAEALEASGRHDERGTDAALFAYDRTLAELEGSAGPAADRAYERIAFHHTVLEEIAGRVPAAAVPGLDRAIANNERLQAELFSAGTGTPPSGSGGNGAGNGQGNGPGGAAKPGVNPGGGVGPGGGATSTASPTDTSTASPKPGKPTDDPAATPKPTRDPKPAATPEPPEPAATDRPDRTPRPRPSPPGPGGQDEQRTPRDGRPN